MKAYIIKGTYTEGNRSFYLDRDGYVVTKDSYLALRDCYATERAAKMVATKKTKESQRQNEYCRRVNEKRIAQGKEPICGGYEDCVYTAFAVEVAW